MENECLHNNALKLFDLENQLMQIEKCRDCGEYVVCVWNDRTGYIMTKSEMLEYAKARDKDER